MVAADRDEEEFVLIEDKEEVEDEEGGGGGGEEVCYRYPSSGEDWEVSGFESERMGGDKREE